MRRLEDKPGRWGPWIGGTEQISHDRDTAAVVSPYDGSTVAHVEQAEAGDVARAVEQARRAQWASARRPRHERAGWLRAAADAVDDSAQDIVESVVRSIGKPLAAARTELRRGPQLLRLCAEEILRLGGTTVPVDAVPGGEGRWSLTKREPYGVVAAITPFNAPVNLLLQKVAPALAAGNAVVVKPAPEVAVTANQLAELLAGCLPDGLVSVVHGGPEVAVALAADQGTSVVSLTGGVTAGRAIQQAAGIKPVLLELGSNSPNIVLADADLDDAATRIALAAFEAAGQQCISAQRIIVHDPVFDSFTERLVAKAAAMRVGNPADAATQIGPVVHDRAAERIVAMVDEAADSGAKLLLDGRGQGTMLGPTLLADVPPAASILRDEVFGPVAVLIRASDLDEAIAIANDAPGMLQASCFTADLSAAMEAAEALRAGSVLINDATRFRLDVSPFGGYGQSGFGREGVRYAMESLSQIKHIGVRPAR